MNEFIKIMKGFRDFILRGNVIDLSVAVVVGAAFNSIVKAFVADLVTPLIAAIGGKRDFSNIYFTVNNSRFMVGDLINEVISFVIVATVIYFFLVLPMNRIVEGLKDGKKSKDTDNRECPECLSIIPKKASRCRFCTAKVKPLQ